MPKIIANIREKLLEEAKKQMLEQGYAAMTIRSVASACGVGVGTVYNYFESKDILIASFMLEDWFECKREIESKCKAAKEPKEALRSVYEGICSFREKYEALFADKDASANSIHEMKIRHTTLRNALADPLYIHCQNQNKVDARFLAEFLAEAILSWMNAGKSFEEISSILLQLF